MDDLRFFAVCDDGAILDFCEKREGEVRIFTLDSNEFKGKKSFEVSSETFNHEPCDEGYYLIPGDEKASGTAVIKFNGKGDGETISIDNPSLSFFASGSSEAVHVVMIENNYYYALKASFTEGKYRVSLSVKTDAQPVRDDFVLRVLTLPASADYNDVAKAIRKYRLDLGEIRPLAEKCREREALDYAARHPLVRVRMGWKPVPPEVLHQTPENEPPMHVACTFSDVRFLADRMKARGVRGAEISLVGWNARGHDGRWPDIFPIEEALGGEEELRKTVEHVRALGYKLTCHTNHADHYEIAGTFDSCDLAKLSDGSYKSHGNWGGGMSYAACPTTQLKYALRDVETLRKLGLFGIHYVDCLSICRPEVCFDEKHPITLSESIKILRKIMSIYTKELGGFSSEGMRDFSVGELDFSLYNCFRSSRLSFLPKTYEMVEAVVPMMEIIYHGILLYNVSSATVNAEIKGDETVSTLALLGGKPALYINSKFLSAKKKVFSGISNNWMGDEDLTSGSEEELDAAADVIKKSEDRYTELLDRQFVFIDSYRVYDGGICVTRYDDGVEIAANFGGEAASYRGEIIEPNKYAVIR